MAEHQKLSSETFRIRALKLALVFTLIICIFMGGIYLYLGAYLAFGMIVFFLPLYAGTAFLLYKGRPLTARVSFLSIFMVHLTLATLLFSPQAGFHFYFFTIPTILGMFFNVEDPKQRLFAVVFIVTATFLFLYFISAEPAAYYTINETWMVILNISSGTVAMLTIFMGFSYNAFKISLFNRELIQMATRDPLTGIFNRREFFNRGKAEIDRSNRYQTPLSLFMIDLDHFKHVNDTYGHAMGDRVLKRFVDTCNIQIRSTDNFARLGGEEFGLLLPESDEQKAATIGERLRMEIENLTIPSESGDIRITISIGICTKTHDAQDLEEMMKEADKALYRAKNTGRNRVTQAQT